MFCSGTTLGSDVLMSSSFGMIFGCCFKELSEGVGVIVWSGAGCCVGMGFSMTLGGSGRVTVRFSNVAVCSIAVLIV